MTQDAGKRDRIASGAGNGARGEMSAVGPGETDRVVFTESGGATVAALLHLLRLMGAELVLVHGADTERFEQAVRTKIEQFPAPTANQQARDAGLARARHLVEQVLTQIRAQAELKRSLAITDPVGPKPLAPDAIQPRLLN